MVKAKQDKNLRWNFAMGLLHGVFFNGGMAFSNSTTILSVFLNTFTHSKIIVGLFSSVMNTGSVLPQLFVANRLENKVYKKPVMKFYVFNLPGAMEQVAQFRPYCRIQKEILRSGLDNNELINYE